MDILLARKELDAKPKKIDLDKVIGELKSCGDKIYYFDRDNSHKDMMNLVETIENEGFSVHLREVKYGLADEEYMYEVHSLEN